MIDVFADVAKIEHLAQGAPESKPCIIIVDTEIAKGKNYNNKAIIR